MIIFLFFLGAKDTSHFSLHDAWISGLIPHDGFAVFENLYFWLFTWKVWIWIRIFVTHFHIYHTFVKGSLHCILVLIPVLWSRIHDSLQNFVKRFDTETLQVLAGASFVPNSHCMWLKYFFKLKFFQFFVVTASW